MLGFPCSVCTSWESRDSHFPTTFSMEKISDKGERKRELIKGDSFSSTFWGITLFFLLDLSGFSYLTLRPLISSLPNIFTLSFHSSPLLPKNTFEATQNQPLIAIQTTTVYRVTPSAVVWRTTNTVHHRQPSKSPSRSWTASSTLLPDRTRSSTRPPPVVLHSDQTHTVLRVQSHTRCRRLTELPRLDRHTDQKLQQLSPVTSSVVTREKRDISIFFFFLTILPFI